MGEPKGTRPASDGWPCYSIGCTTASADHKIPSARCAGSKRPEAQNCSVPQALRYRGTQETHRRQAPLDLPCHGGSGVDEGDRWPGDFRDKRTEKWVVRAAEHDGVGAGLEQRSYKSGDQAPGGFARQIAALDCFGQSGRGLGDPMTSWAKSSSRAAKRELWRVPTVARIPTTPLRVAATAGFTAGSMPMMGTSGHAVRSVAAAAAVAVLQAITNALAPRPNKNPASARDRSTMNPGLLLPYGTWAESAT